MRRITGVTAYDLSDRTVILKCQLISDDFPGFPRILAPNKQGEVK